MTPDQLASARAAHWREDAQPILTLEDAKAWLERMQLCLYLPRKTHVLAPAPSFVGAVLGQSSATPPPEAIQQAQDLLVRLVAEGSVVPLNLFGTAGEQPDFLIVTAALPHLAALQADRNWKKPPVRSGPGKVSPLAIEIWKLLEREGALTAIEIREQLGHELTEAAIIRGLSELWQNLRVAPLPQENGEPAHWEILSVTHKKEMAAGGTLAQSTALSLLVSYYIQSVLTATAEDIEAFLSPVASRSRLRDVIRGLSATRQLRTLSMDAQTFFFIDGTLPDMPEVAAAESPETAKPAFMGRSAYRERMLNKGREEEEPKKEDTSPSTYRERRDSGASFTERPRTDRPRRSAAPSDRSGGRPSFSERPWSAPPRREGGPARPSRFGAGGSSRPPRPSFGDRARSGSDRPPFRKSAGEAGEDRPARPFTPRPFTPRTSTDRPGSGRPAFGGRPAAGGGRPFRPRTEGDRPGRDRGGERPSRPFTPREGGSFRKSGDAGSRPFRPQGGRPVGGSGGSRPAFRGKPSEGGARPFRPRPEGDRPSRPRSGDSRPFSPRPFGGKPSGSSPRPFSRSKDADQPRRERSGEARPFRPKPSGDRDRPAREGSSRPPFRGKPAEGGGRPASSGERGSRPSFPRREGGGRSELRPPRPGGSFTRRDGPPGAGRPSTGRPSSGRPSRPGTPGRNPGGTGRPGGVRPGGSRPGGFKPGGPRAGSPRPGGMRPPTRKPKPESDKE